VKLTPGGSTDKGQVRDGNEDGYVVDRRLQLFAVADGMGGHRAGEVASATALEALRAAIASGIGLGDAITNANTAVHDKSASDRQLSGMGTTLTAVIPDGRGVLVGHVGDSRAYLLRDGELRQLTTDHSLVEELVRGGRLTEQEAAVHPQRSVITRALGVDDAVDVDVYSVPLEAGDRLLLCSDGLTTMLRADDIAALLRRETDPTRAANLLVDAANAAGGEDNITTIVIDVEEDGVDPLAPAPVAAADTTATPVVPAPDAPATPDSDVHPAGAEAETAPAAPTSSLPAGASAAKALADKARREKRAERERHPFRATGRFVRFAVPIILILGLAVAMTAWYARRTYFVAFDKSGQVTVYQGRPGGLLLWDPTVIRRSKLTKKDLPEDALVDVEDQKEFANRGDAVAFAGRIEARATAAISTTTTTTTTTTVVPSVIVPPPAT
jgi:protein phosphatase